MTATVFPGASDTFVSPVGRRMNDPTPGAKSTEIVAHLQNASRALQDSARSFAERRVEGSDFHGSAANLTFNTPFSGSGAIASGTNTTTPAAGDHAALHPGIMLLRSSASASSGFRIASGASLVGGSGLCYRAIFRPLVSVATTTYYLGVHNGAAGSTAEPTSGCYLAIAPGGTGTFKGANAGSRTNGASTMVFAAGVWYTVDISWTSDSAARCVVRNDAGTVLLNTTVASNVPNTTAQLLLAQFVAFNSTTNADICLADGVWFGPARPAAMAFPN